VEVVVPQSSPEVDTNGLYFTLEEQNIWKTLQREY
jgi:hypothetical protein